MIRSTQNHGLVPFDFGRWQVRKCAGDCNRLCAYYYVDIVFFLVEQSLAWCCSEWECPKSFLAHNNFSIGYLRNDTMPNTSYLLHYYFVLLSKNHTYFIQHSGDVASQITLWFLVNIKVETHEHDCNFQIRSTEASEKYTFIFVTLSLHCLSE